MAFFDDVLMGLRKPKPVIAADSPAPPPPHRPTLTFEQRLQRGFPTIGAAVTGAQALHDRYGAQGKMDRAVNSNVNMLQDEMRERDLNQGIDKLSDDPTQPPSPSSDTGYDPEAGADASDTPPSLDDVGEAFARGGVATRPTRAVLGEQGPEAVVPLNGGGNMQQPRQSLSPQQAMKQQPIGMRGDGRQVPGNEQGGANGRYGGYGQHPNAPIPRHVSQNVQRAAAHGRYGGGQQQPMNQTGGQPDQPMDLGAQGGPPPGALDARMQPIQSAAGGNQQNAAQVAGGQSFDQGHQQLAQAVAAQIGQGQPQQLSPADQQEAQRQQGIMQQYAAATGGNPQDRDAAAQWYGKSPQGQAYFAQQAGETTPPSGATGISSAGTGSQNAAQAATGPTFDQGHAQYAQQVAQATRSQSAPAATGQQSLAAAPTPSGVTGMPSAGTGQQNAAQAATGPSFDQGRAQYGQQAAQAARTQSAPASTAPATQQPAATASASPTQPTPQATPTAPSSQPQSGARQPQATPFGMLAHGGIVTHPTKAIIGENGPEAVIPLDNPSANITPGMFSQHRYRPMTGPAMTHHPIGAMPPASLDPKMSHPSGWKKWDIKHGKF